jgi:hypothetical protein
VGTAGTMTTRRSRSGVLGPGRSGADPRRRPRLEMRIAAAALTVISVALAPAASADATDSFRAAVAAARPPACGPIRSDPLIDQVATEINDSTDRWINFASRAVPEGDAMPLLHDLGYVGATKARILSGAATNAGSSIKGALLQGFAILPDCSLNAYGVATKHNARKDLVLVTAVLAG